MGRHGGDETPGIVRLGPSRCSELIPQGGREGRWLGAWTLELAGLLQILAWPLMAV